MNIAQVTRVLGTRKANFSQSFNSKTNILISNCINEIHDKPKQLITLHLQ